MITQHHIAMKKFLPLFFFALALSCGRNEPQSAVVQLTVRCEMEDGAAKTAINGNREILWGENEYVRLWYHDGKDRFATSGESSASASSGEKIASFTFSVPVEAASSYSVGGIYPASCAVAVGGVDNGNPEAYKVTLPAAQTAPAGTYDPAAYLMVMRSATMAEFPQTLTAYWKRAVSLNHLTLTGLGEDVNAVEICCPGKAFAGKATVDLKTGRLVEVYEPSESVTVQTALSVGTGTLYFTSWDVQVAAGEQVVIRAIGAANTYTKTITASGSGISFSQGQLCKLSVDFSGVEADHISLSDFAVRFVTLLDAWQANTGSVSVGGGDTFKDVHLVPADWSFQLGAVRYNRSNAYDVALQGFCALYDGGTMADAVPVARGYAWGDNPYNEGAGNGGAFQNEVVGLDLLRNYASRALPWAANNQKWSNFCWYTDADGNLSTLGTPQVTAYKGVCCLERSLLLVARFFRYLLDNHISDNIASACAAMQLDASLYEYAYQPIRFSVSSVSMKTLPASAVSVTVQAETAWQVDGVDGAWLSAAKAEGNLLRLEAAPNYSGAVRSGQVRVRAGTETASLPVSQEADNSLFLGAKTEMGRRFVHQSGTLVTKVTSDAVTTLDNKVHALKLNFTSSMSGTASPYAMFLFDIDMTGDVTLVATCANDDDASIKKTDASLTSTQIMRSQLSVLQSKRSGLRVFGGVNADFFLTKQNNLLHGVLHRRGVCLKDSFDGGAACTVFAVMQDGTPHIFSQSEYAENKAGIREAVGGRQRLLNNGKTVSTNNTTFEPRTAVGVSRDGTHVLLLAVDGRRDGWSVGASYLLLSQILAAMGAYNAINLDGGGSTTFVTHSSTSAAVSTFVTENKPTDSAGDRAVVDGLAIVK
ncbi:MAG: phosphodiester glycosidase family protein [Bacteroidales bacterium]|nr:phosphodiester glycosidase family protein [Bacteroidales bacterium]